MAFHKPDPLSIRDDVQRENERKRREAGERRQRQAAFRKARKAHARNSAQAFEV